MDRLCFRFSWKKKRKRSDSVLWQKPLNQQKCQRGKVTTQTTPQKSLIKQRLRTDLGRSVGVTTATQLVWLTGLRAHLPTKSHLAITDIKMFVQHFCLRSSVNQAVSWGTVQSKRRVPRDVQNSTVLKQDKYRRDWSCVSILETCKSQSGIGLGLRRSKRPLSACHTRCRCPMET